MRRAAAHAAGIRGRSTAIRISREEACRRDRDGRVWPYGRGMGRYGKRADLIVHEHEPFNAETSLAALDEGPLTATDAFYVRGHGPVPEIDPAAWRLRVHGLVERELDLSLSTLREAFRERTETVTQIGRAHV